MFKILVIMPYTQEWSERVWEALLSISREDSSKRIYVYRVDTTQIVADRLEDHFEKKLSEADVIIADLTNVNPNVHIEIGFALTMRKPLLLITQDRKWVATHLQGRIIEEYDPKSDESLSLLSTKMLLRVKDKLDIIEAMHETKRFEIATQIKYQVECYSDRRAIGLERYFREAENRIDILTTNLSFLFEEHGAPINKGKTRARTYFDEINNSLDREGSRIRVRILTLDPESDFAAKRGKQLGFAPGIFRDALRRALSETAKLALKYSTDKFEIRIYEDLPNQITYRIDNLIFNCVIAQPTQSRHHLTFKLDRRYMGVDNSFIIHFQNAWGVASRI